SFAAVDHATGSTLQAAVVAPVAHVADVTPQRLACYLCGNRGDAPCVVILAARMIVGTICASDEMSRASRADGGGRLDQRHPVDLSPVRGAMSSVAVETAPGATSHAAFAQATALHDAGKFAEAETLLRDAIARDPANLILLNARGVMLAA